MTKFQFVGTTASTRGIGFFIVSWSKDSIADTLNNGSNFNHMGWPSLNRKGGTNATPTKGRNNIREGDYVIIANCPTEIAYAVVRVTEVLSPADGLIIGQAVWPSGTHTATHRCDPLKINGQGVNISQFARESIDKARGLSRWGKYIFPGVSEIDNSTFQQIHRLF